jgi:hypothetical protein
MLGGPHVTFSGGTSSGGKFYASLTGAGETATPGALTQLGTFYVTATHPTVTNIIAATFSVRSTATRALVTMNAKWSTANANILVEATKTNLFAYVTIRATAGTSNEINLKAGASTSVFMDDTNAIVTSSAIALTSVHIFLKQLPTSTAGLGTGCLWRTGNTVKIVP